MEEIEPNEQKFDDELIEDINKLDLSALGEGVAACQECGEKLREGAEITAYAFRPAGTPTYQIGTIICADHHDQREHYTLGVRELVVDGRIGCCYDVATQSSWLVLLAPACHAVSPANTRSAHALPTDARLQIPVGPPTHKTTTDGVDAHDGGN